MMKSYSDNEHIKNQSSNAFSFPHLFHLKHLQTSPYISTTSFKISLSFKIQESGWDNSLHLIHKLDMSLLIRNYFTSDSAKLAAHFNHKNIIPREIHNHIHTSENFEPKKYSPQRPLQVLHQRIDRSATPKSFYVNSSLDNIHTSKSVRWNLRSSDQISNTDKVRSPTSSVPQIPQGNEKKFDYYNLGIQKKKKKKKPQPCNDVNQITG